MISKNSSHKKTFEEFQSELIYLGVAIETKSALSVSHFVDLEEFFLAATYNLQASRIAEGFLCWLMRYGHLLSPSKTRRLIQLNAIYDQSIFGGFVEYLMSHNINSLQWRILKPFVKRNKTRRPLIDGPRPHSPNPVFLKYNIVVHDYKCDEEKFLTPTSQVYKNCVELKNRALFGSVVNADVASYLKWNPKATPYQIAKAIHNHKARVFEVYEDIKVAI
ncbi:MAG: hypothetical protein A2Z20_06175 [Bdellovibrionales bacterium RBG_16_40_8]|nr:MAG: hypothetical protein A2Z20_06175 [Bdellovibrionales bacterium RBG_16_40_8]